MCVVSECVSGRIYVCVCVACINVHLCVHVFVCVSVCVSLCIFLCMMWGITIKYNNIHFSKSI